MLNKFKNPKLLVISLLSIFIVITPLLIINFKLSEVEEEILLYLQEDRGYTVNEIESIKKDFDRLPRYSLWVTFKDDSYTNYQYTVKRNQVIQQTYEVNKAGQEKGIVITTPKHYDPPKSIERRY